MLVNSQLFNEKSLQYSNLYLVFNPDCVEYEGTELLKNSDADITDIQYLESSNKIRNRNMIKAKGHREIKACQHDMNKVIFFLTKHIS